MIRATWTIVGATLEEARRRRILFATVLFGCVFVILFSVGIYFAQKDMIKSGVSALTRPLYLGFLIMAGLYATNFLTVITAAFLPVDTLSGEISSGVMQTVASKPIPRASIVLGKWLAHAIVLIGYVLLVAGGVILAARTITGVTPPNLVPGLGLLMLEGLTVLTVSIAFGTRFSTIANGITCVGLYGMAFLGGWFEQIGTFANVTSAASIGTITSLLFPSESMWQLAAHTMQPAIMRDLSMTPFSPISVPSVWMVVWTCMYVVIMLAYALRTFSRRTL